MSYIKQYLLSSDHAIAALATIGGGLIVGNLLGLIVGATAYAVSWIYLPTSAHFRNKVEQKAKAETDKEDAQAKAEFIRKRDIALNTLNIEDTNSYLSLVDVCKEIERNGVDENVLGKLQGLMWTYLKLLSMKEAITHYLSEVDKEKVSTELEEVKEEITTLTTLVGGGKPEVGSSKEKLLQSRQSVAEVLQQRKTAIEKAEENKEIVESESERLGHQIRLLQAEVVGNRNSDVITDKINNSVESIKDTNSMLKGLESYTSFVEDTPPANLGYGEENIERTPVVEVPATARRRVRTRLVQ